MSDHPNDPFDELMRRALAEEADRTEPADGLHEIQARVRAQRKPVNRRPWVLTAGAAVLGTAAAVGAFAVLDDNAQKAGDTEVAGPTTTTTATSAPPVTAEPTNAPTATTPGASPAPKETTTKRGTPEPMVKGRAVPVYWLGPTVGFRTGPGVRLYRTFSQIDGRPGFEAVRLMTSAKSGDPDYQSPWLGATVASVSRSDGLITVDFKQLPRQSLKPDVANVATQQLVYTVQGAMEVTEPVQVTQQGRPVSTLFGVDSKQPISRAQALDVQAFIWVNSPLNGMVVSAPLKVSGVAAVNEAQLNWRVIATDTRKLVAEGNAMTTEAFKVTPYTFTVQKLPSGTYTLEVFESSAEDGRATSTDTKTFYIK